jgi:PAS domain S-box-containing protein
VTVQSALLRCVAEGQPYDLEFRFTTAKRRQLWIHAFAEPVLENGKVVRVVGFIMDITERKLAEKKSKYFSKKKKSSRKRFTTVSKTI